MAASQLSPQPTCPDCGFRKCSLNGTKTNWRKRCTTCRNKPGYKSPSGKAAGRAYVGIIDKSSCSRCGFVPEDPCQIDIDHIDGDRDNNDSKNLQALCANCHRLKTKRSRNGIYALKPAA